MSECTHVNLTAGCESCEREANATGRWSVIAEQLTPEEWAERRAYRAEEKAKALVEQLGKFVNGMNREESDAFATALANEHPTLLGQIAKAVGVGVMRRTLHDPQWKAYDTTVTAKNMCLLDFPTEVQHHPEHDGRLDCATVAGAELMARQSFI